MSLYDSVHADAVEAQHILAEMKGLAPEATGNTLFPSETVPVVGEWGKSRVIFTPMQNGGYRKKTEIVLKISREQRAAAPQPNTKVTRIDLTPPLTYNIENVDTQDSHFWVLVVANFAN